VRRAGRSPLRAVHSGVPRIVTPAEFRIQPWKNGGGVTREIVRWPDSGAYEIRASLADAAPGPFSRFPGYRRWSFLAGAAPIVLEAAGVAHELAAPGDHLEVAGEVAIRCALPAGPTRLLNVLVRDGVAAQLGRGPCAVAVRFVFALAAMPWLPEGHAAVFDPPAIAALERHAVWLA
jgi:environmental stress-induced protein Ves